MSSLHPEPLVWCYYNFMNDTKELILKLCNSEEGISFEELSKTINCENDLTVINLNELLKAGELELLQVNQNVKYRTKSTFAKELQDDERVVYSVIDNSGNSGIWIRDIKTKSCLHQTVLNKCIKQLELKNLIRQVKSSKHPTRKMYISFSRTYDDEASLSSWYTDNEVDVELVSEVFSLLRKLFEKTQGHGLDALEILKFLKSSNVLTLSISLKEVEEILSVMVFENLIKESKEDGKKAYALVTEHIFECGVAFS